MNNVEYQDIVFYSEIDCLLDVKPNIIKEYSQELFIKLIGDKTYFSREEDNFFPEFQERYRNRTIYDLYNGIVTEAINLLHEFVLNIETSSLTGPISYKPVVIVNTYPYNVENPESIIKALVYKTAGKADIQVVRMTPEEVTPSFLKKNTSIALMYNPWDWLETHSVNKNLTKVTCPEVTLMSPKLFHCGIPNITEKEKNQIFKEAEEFTGRCISLKLLPPFVFSMITTMPVWKTTAEK